MFLRGAKIHNFFYLGASKFALARVDFSNPLQPHLVYFKEAPAQGFYLGRLSDLELASREVRLLFEGAGLDSFPEITLVISSPDLNGYTFASSIFYSTPKHVIEAEDLEEVIRQTRNVSMVPLKETVIQAVPQEFWVNDTRGIQNPLDLEAERLGVSLRIITLNSENYKGLIKVFDRSEAEIKAVFPKALAASYAVLEDDEKRDGVLLVEMGGYATDFVYFKDNTLFYSNAIPWGSDSLTQSLMDRFHLKVHEARQIKEEFGTLISGPTDEEQVPVIQRDEGPAETMRRGELREFLLRNLEVSWSVFEKEVRSVEKIGRISQIVISGGGSKLEGLLEKIEEKFSIRTRYGNPKNFGIETDQSKGWDSRFASLWGAVRQKQESLRSEKARKTGQNLLGRATTQAREWLETYF